MSKLHHFFHGYRKHYLVWLAILIVIGVAVVATEGSVISITDMIPSIIIVPPILAFITLSISKGLRRLFGSKDFM